MPSMNETNMTGDKRILIVEDDKDINTLIAYNLKKSGFSVEQEFNGKDAMRKIREEVFDIVILDIMLPEIDGFDICKEIEDDPRYFRSFVVVVSAKSRQQDRLYAHLLGADYYLSKPFTISELMAAVNEIIRSVAGEYSVKNG